MAVVEASAHGREHLVEASAHGRELYIAASGRWPLSRRPGSGEPPLPSLRVLGRIRLAVEANQALLLQPGDESQLHRTIQRIDEGPARWQAHLGKQLVDAVVVGQLRADLRSTHLRWNVLRTDWANTIGGLVRGWVAVLVSMGPKFDWPRPNLALGTRWRPRPARRCASGLVVGWSCPIVFPNGRTCVFNLGSILRSHFSLIRPLCAAQPNEQVQH